MVTVAATVLIEACVDDLTTVHAAIRGGADRLELCDNLADGGTTPSHGFVAQLFEQMAIPAFPMVRLRGGSFVYSEDELHVMLRDARHFHGLGVPGLVFGALTQNDEVDWNAVSRIRDAAPHAAFTFHRAFDRCRDPHETVEILIQLGVNRILTSGHQESVWDGRGLIADLVRQAGDRITILAGGGVRPEIVRELVATTGVREVHASLRGDHERIAALKREVRREK